MKHLFRLKLAALLLILPADQLMMMPVSAFSRQISPPRQRSIVAVNRMKRQHSTSNPFSTSSALTEAIDGKDRGTSRPRKRNRWSSILKIYKAEDSERTIIGAAKAFLVKQRPDIESGRRYQSKDWFTNLLTLPNSLVLRRIKFHLISNTILSLVVVSIHRYVRPIGIPVLAHTLVGR